ncbi:hypothetical protein DY000_02020453 [Brassica cretica]|uniref:DUF4283 domain-containing protein n=1 Tax=Brassica cretica TaxID=69181 RepID=A0ABQ7E383_BRACR|nr:hypothetical protein DY000_02020453 [Brassica cretica]
MWSQNKRSVGFKFGQWGASHVWKLWIRLLYLSSFIQPVKTYPLSFPNVRISQKQVLHRDDDLHGLIEGKRDTGLILALTLGSPEPVREKSYPSEITFWVLVLGVPIEFWAAQTFDVEVVDVDYGRVKVVLD